MKPHLPSIAAAFAGLLSLATPVPAQAQENAVRVRTVVIDPGHGGHDAGCISRDKKTYEKDIVLDVATKLRDKIKAAFPEVSVILTRDDDTFIPLDDRAGTANRNNADLFISIHVNSVDKGTTANGFSIHTLGQSQRKGNDLFSKNLDLCQRENSVREGNSLMQNAHLEQSLQFAADVADAMGSSPIRTNRGISQDPFLVLWRTTMPSVLIEVGFISNPTDLAVMKSEQGRDGIAGNIFRAFRQFKRRYDGTVNVPAPKEPVQTAPQEQNGAPETAAPASGKVDGVRYGTQVLATGKAMAASDPFFKGYTVESVSAGKLIRYFVGVSADLDEARKKYRELKKKFPDSFLVKIEGETTTRVQ